MTHRQVAHPGEKKKKSPDSFIDNRSGKLEARTALAEKADKLHGSHTRSEMVRVLLISSRSLSKRSLSYFGFNNGTVASPKASSCFIWHTMLSCFIWHAGVLFSNCSLFPEMILLQFLKHKRRLLFSCEKMIYSKHNKAAKKVQIMYFLIMIFILFLNYF